MWNSRGFTTKRSLSIQLTTRVCFLMIINVNKAKTFRLGLTRLYSSNTSCRSSTSRDHSCITTTSRSSSRSSKGHRGCRGSYWGLRKWRGLEERRELGRIMGLRVTLISMSLKWGEEVREMKWLWGLQLSLEERTLTAQLRDTLWTCSSSPIPKPTTALTSCATPRVCTASPCSQARAKQFPWIG